MDQNAAPTILIVDDDDDNRKLLVFRIRRIRVDGMRINIKEAADGDEAVETTKQFAPSVILMDMNMPRVSGAQATREIRSMGAPLADTPIVLLTAESPSSSRELVTCGASDYLPKPIIDPAELEAKILHWIANRHSSDKALSPEFAQAY